MWVRRCGKNSLDVMIAVGGCDSRTRGIRRGEETVLEGIERKASAISLMRNSAMEILSV